MDKPGGWGGYDKSNKYGNMRDYGGGGGAYGYGGRGNTPEDKDWWNQLKKDNGENGMDQSHVHFNRELKDERNQAWWKKHGYKDSRGVWQVRMDDRDRDNHTAHDDKSNKQKKASDDHDEAVERDPEFQELRR